jgi:hypothetical protein
MAVIDQLEKSTLSLRGNNLNPQSQQPAWGYQSLINGIIGGIQPEASELHNTYSVNSIPSVRIIDFNRSALGGVTAVKVPSILDELDVKAPKLIPFGVVSQAYKSKVGQQYKQLGPSEGRY